MVRQEKWKRGRRKERRAGKLRGLSTDPWSDESNQRPDFRATVSLNRQKQVNGHSIVEVTKDRQKLRGTSISGHFSSACGEIRRCPGENHRF